MSISCKVFSWFFWGERVFSSCGLNESWAKFLSSILQCTATIELWKHQWFAYSQQPNRVSFFLCFFSPLDITSPHFLNPCKPLPLPFCSPGWVDNFVWLSQFIPESRAMLTFIILSTLMPHFSRLWQLSESWAYARPRPRSISPSFIRSCGQGLHCMANEIELAAVALQWIRDNYNDQTILCVLLKLLLIPNNWSNKTIFMYIYYLRDLSQLSHS